jgi:hypothetical protein
MSGGVARARRRASTPNSELGRLHADSAAGMDFSRLINSLFKALT